MTDTIAHPQADSATGSALIAAEFNVISNGLHAAAQEMGAKLIRSAYSTIIREAADCSTSLLTAKGEIIAQAHMCPIHMNSFGLVWEAFAKEYDLSTLQPGEALLTNDPYHGGQHLNDFVLFTPIFHEEVLIGFAASLGHQIDVGGGAAGPNTSATEIYHEGLRLPLLRFDVERDLNDVGWLQRIIGINVRVPDIVLGDLRAQLAANRTGEARVLELVERFSRGRVLEVSEELQNYSERLARSVITELPNGTYSAEDFVDDSGFSDEPLRVAVAITIDGDSMHIDLAGSSDQCKGIVNSPITSTYSSVLGAVALLLGAGEIPVNQGLFRSVSVDVPYGSFLNPSQPLAVRARTSACNRVYNAVMRAMAEVAPERIVASGHDSTHAIGLAQFGPDRYRVYMECVGGGWGAAYGHDGADVVDAPLANTSNVPIESVEIDHPYMMIEEYSLRPDSSGPGHWRGGSGARRVYRILGEDVMFNAYSDRHRIAPWGIFGGEDATKTRFSVERDGEVIILPSKVNFSLQRGDRLVIETAGGGGFGSPSERDHDLITLDVANGVLTPEGARSQYGWEGSEDADADNGD